MITLKNRAVQDNLYEILNLDGNPHMWTHGNYKGENYLVVKNNETTTTSYPYNSKEDAEADYKEIIRIKEILKA